MLYYLADLPVTQIAEELGTTVNTVRSWLARGRSALKRLLGSIVEPIDMVAESETVYVLTAEARVYQVAYVDPRRTWFWPDGSLGRPYEMAAISIGDGALWLLDRADGGCVLRVDLKTKLTSEIPLSGVGASIAAGSPGPSSGESSLEASAEGSTLAGPRSAGSPWMDSSSVVATVWSRLAYVNGLVWLSATRAERLAWLDPNGAQPPHDSIEVHGCSIEDLVANGVTLLVATECAVDAVRDRAVTASRPLPGGGGARGWRLAVGGSRLWAVAVRPPGAWSVRMWS